LSPVPHRELPSAGGGGIIRLMVLSPDDARLFLHLHRCVHRHANMAAQVVAEEIGDDWSPVSRDGLKLREWLYERIDDVVDGYVDENPDALDGRALAIVRSWKEAIHGRFTIERLLKSQAIFIGDDERVYGVLGITNELEEVLPQRPPLVVDSALLPFEGRIVYDGVLFTYAVHLGPGYARSLRGTYERAKQNRRIITSLGVDVAAPKALRPEPELAKALHELRVRAQSLRATKENLAARAALKVLDASFGLAITAALQPESFEEISDELDDVRRAHNKLATILARMD